MKFNPKIILLLVFLLGFFLRFFMLGQNPPSLNWDEVSTGYNAYSILKTGKDEYGNFLPLSIRSFDDYKPALYTYLAIPAISVIGLTEFAIRFPSAILGSISILIIYFLTKEILIGKKYTDTVVEQFSLTASFLFAISPWSLQFSRAAYEGNIGLFFLLTGVLFLFKFLKKPRFLFAAVTFFLFSLYSYHSFRLIVPLFLVGFCILYFKNLLKHKLVLLVSLATLILFSLPIYSSFIFSDSGTASRLSMVTIFGDTPELQKSIVRLEYDKEIGNPLGYVFENRRFVYALAAITGYLKHYDPDFLFLHGDGGVQHHAVDFGMLYLFSLPLIIFGFYFLGRNFTKKIGVLFLLLILAPIASAVSSGAPHPVRAIVMAPIFDMAAAVGFVTLFHYLLAMKRKYVVLGVMITLIGLFLLNVLYYFNQYYVHTPREYGYFWQAGNKEAVEYAYLNRDKFENIIITYKYDQPYAFYLYYNKIDPAWYQSIWNFTGDGMMPRFERQIDNIQFRNINYSEDSKLRNTLLIGTPDEIPKNTNLVKEIEFPDGSTAYRISKTN